MVGGSNVICLSQKKKIMVKFFLFLNYSNFISGICLNLKQSYCFNIFFENKFLKQMIMSYIKKLDNEEKFLKMSWKL